MKRKNAYPQLSPKKNETNYLRILASLPILCLIKVLIMSFKEISHFDQREKSHKSRVFHCQLLMIIIGETNGQA